MKNVIYIYLFVTVSFAVTACTDDILDKKPLDIITDLDVWKSEALIKTYINGIYTYMDFMYVDTQDFGHYPWSITDALTNDDTSGPGFAGSPKWGNLTAESGWLNWWGYDAIRQMNYAIEQLPNATVDEEIIKSSLAEVRFLRAYSYFHMVKLFGGVPLITEAQSLDAAEEELYPVRAKEEEIYNFVISELDAIAEDLPEILPSSEYGRPTKNAGLALKARAALYAGSIAQYGTVKLDGIVGIPSEKSIPFYQESYDASKALMDYSQANPGILGLKDDNPDLVKNFQDIFYTRNHVENIFSKCYWSAAGFGGTGPANIWNLPESPGFIHPWGAGHSNNCYLEFINAFENADGSDGTLQIPEGWITTEELWGNKEPRFFASIYTENTPYEKQEGTTFVPTTVRVHQKVKTLEGEIMTSGTYQGINVAPTGQGKVWGCLKYTRGNQWPSPYDWILFRYGEVLLNNAEAAFELGKTGEALNAVNQIRARVGLPALGSITRDLIRHERRIELAFESHRYWDLRRWRIAEEKLNGSLYHHCEVTLDYASFAEDPLNTLYHFDIIPQDQGQSMVFEPKHYYLPIQPSRISNNPNLVENPGY